MLAFNRRVRGMLLGQALALFAAGGAFALGAGAVPYGRWWAPVLGGAFGLALIPLGLYLRCRILTRRLLRARRFTLSASEIPVRAGHTYLGEGFRWSSAQTERLHHLSGALRQRESPERDLIAGDWWIHGLGADRLRPVYLPDSLLNQHIFLMGAPGSGKTRGLELLVEQAVRRGDALVVIDPKGDEGLLDRTYDAAVRHGRGPQFRVLALPYPYASSRYNPLESFVTPSDVADRICSIMPRRGEGEAFRNYAWQFVSVVATALHELGEKVSLAKLERYTFHDPWALIGRLVSRLCPGLTGGDDPSVLVREYRQECARRGSSDLATDQMIELARMNREHFGKISGSLRTVLSKLTSASVGYLLSPEDLPVPAALAGRDVPPTLSWTAIDHERLVVYFFLGSLIGGDSAGATARMCLADLMGYIGRKYAFDDAAGFAQRRLTVIVDEVGDALAPEAVNLLNKARGAGLSIIMAGQSLADLEVALGHAAEARRALANVGSFLILRAANPDDARYFAEKVGERPLPVVTTSVQYEPTLVPRAPGDAPDYRYRSSTSVSMRSQALLAMSALDRLARFHYFGLWAGELRKGLLPVLAPPEHRYAPSLKGGGLGEGSPGLAEPGRPRLDEKGS